MTFKALQYDSGKVKQLKLDTGAEPVKGDPLEFDATSGGVKLAVETTDNCYFVALADYDSSVANPEGTILAVATEGVEFEAKTDAETNENQVGKVYKLKATTGVVDNATPGDCFLVTKIVGPAANKTVRGYFLSRKEAAA